MLKAFADDIDLAPKETLLCQFLASAPNKNEGQKHISYIFST